MRKLFSVLSLVLLFVTISFGQAAITIPVTVEDSHGNIQTVYFGLDPAATSGIDASLGESELPPFPPGGAFDGRFINVTGQSQLGEGSLRDFRTAAGFPFSGTYTHRIRFQPGDPLPDEQTITVSWNLPPEILNTSTITLLGFSAVPFFGTGSLTAPAPVADNDRVTFVVNYSNISPAGPAPVFEIAPPSLSFGSVNVGSNAVLPVTVSNTGDADLTISAISSSDGQFTFTPPAPVTIIPGGNQVFNVTFTPTSAGPKSGTISFTHNAAGSPGTLAVSGTGVEPGPTFSANPTSLNFGNVGVGATADLTVTVTNNGSANPLNISNVAGSPAQYTVTPTNAVVPPLGNQVFTVTFAPTAVGSLPGTLTFTDNAPGSPHTVGLIGNGVLEQGLIFEDDTVYNYEDDSYTATMQLIGNTGFLHAMQFRLLSNQAVDDNTILTYQSIQKGSNVSGANWILETNVVRGPITANGASEDTIYVLLYNINATGDLPAGDYLDMFTVTYRVARLQPLQNNIKSSFRIFNAQGSTYEGFPIDITPSRNELVVIAQAAGGGYGDVNGDGCVDILDLIMVVDHIVGRDSLTGSQFDRANIAPWAVGDPAPTPDAVVNVQDLSLIQNIILTGFYPNGEPVAPCGYLSKVDGPVDATVTIYINSEGITSYVDAEVGIRGAQIEFGNVASNPENMVISTPLGQGYYLRVNELLRTLMYDRNGQQYIDAGVNNFMADMPFSLTDPTDVSVAKIVLVDIDTKKLQNIVIQTIYGTPTLPLDYILFQNYPNPFNPSTAVKFQVPKTSDVTITIYDMLGQEVRTLFAGEVMRGNYTVNWDGVNKEGAKVASGTYVYRMTAGEFVQSKKMVLIK